MKGALALLLCSSIALAQDVPADAPKAEARPAFVLLKNQPMPVDGIAMDNAQAALVGKRIARCEAEMDLVESKVLVDKPVLIGGLVAVVVLVGGAFAAGYAAARATSK